jgi:hypothetical protein
MNKACLWAFAVVMTLPQLPVSAQTANKQSAKQQALGGKGHVANSSASEPSSKPAAAKAVTAVQALKIVSMQPEVREWKRSVEKAATKQRPVKAHIEVDRQEAGKFVVHVYEEVPDDSETSHSATFNWYYVDSRTGKVTKEF